MSRFLLKTTLFLALPLALLEIGLRLLVPGPLSGVDHLLDIYGPVGLIAEHRGMDHLFIGTSRIGAAVRPDVFAERAQEAEPERTTPVTTYRAWSGYSTLAMHYLGLRNVLAADPDALRGSTVFIEAPAGLAEPLTWDARWARDEWPELLGATLRPRDLPGLWATDNSLRAKTVATLATVSYTVRFATQVKGKVMRTLDGAVARFEPPTPQIEDLAAERGVATDSVGVAAVRGLIGDEVRTWTRTQTPRDPIDWNESVLADLVRLVRDAGGEVVLFKIPFSPQAERVFATTPVLVDETARLHRWLTEHQVPYLDPDITYTDADFPDLAHLRASRAAEFTAKLADAYLARPAVAPSEP